MKNNWKDIKWIFEPDGTLRDIYVQDVDESDYRKVVDLLNSEYELKFGSEGVRQIDFKYLKSMWNDESGQIESKSVAIDLNGILINSHFFIPDQIEFDLDPKQISQMGDLQQILNFMTNISKTISKQVTLTDENRVVFPLIKIDTQKERHIVLSKVEMMKISKKAEVYPNWFVRMKNLLFPKRLSVEEFEYETMKSAFREFESTPKERNVW